MIRSQCTFNHTVNHASFSLSSFKQASIFYKKGSQCKPRNNLNIISSLYSFYWRQYNYCIRWVVCLDKISPPEKGAYTSKTSNKRKWRFKSTIRSLASQNIVPYNQTHKFDKQNGQGGLHCFGNQTSTKKGVKAYPFSILLMGVVVVGISVYYNESCEFESADGEMYSIQH
jgi:hypothetical protein